MTFIKVSEVMSRNPIKVQQQLSARDAAKVMTEKGVSCLLVEKEGKIAGIVTERDIVTKVAAKNLSPESVKMTEIMSSPLVYIEQDSPLEAAAEIMWKRKIRRLPVISQNGVVGILTENDIVRISPGLIEITRGIMTDREGEIIKGIHGVCDNCSEFSENLVYKAGKYYCERCFTSLEPI